MIGYGKLGGIELGYSSDLDLVLLHDSSGARQDTAGERSIDNQVFFVRYAQRLLHLLTMHSAAGRLYEVDVRLRPSGKGGMLITSIDAFVEYQQQEAWTFEHQALLHARAVAGAEALRDRFEQVRLEVLARYVRRERLREEVRDMRKRMRRERSQAKEGQFDLKMDAGGIADIEFLAQYWALRVGGRVSAGGALFRHHPAARVGGLGGSGAAGDGRHPDPDLSALSPVPASSLARRPGRRDCCRRADERAFDDYRDLARGHGGSRPCDAPRWIRGHRASSIMSP